MAMMRTYTDMYNHRASWLRRENLLILNGAFYPYQHKIHPRLHGLHIASRGMWVLYDRGMCREMITVSIYDGGRVYGMTYARYYPQVRLRWYTSQGNIKVDYQLYVGAPVLNTRRDAITQWKFAFDPSGNIVSDEGPGDENAREFVLEHMCDRSLLLNAMARSFM
jgi:hypothetical protein